MPTPYQRARASMRAANQLIALQRGIQQQHARADAGWEPLHSPLSSLPFLASLPPSQHLQHVSHDRHSPMAARATAELDDPLTGPAACKAWLAGSNGHAESHLCAAGGRPTGEQEADEEHREQQPHEPDRRRSRSGSRGEADMAQPIQRARQALRRQAAAAQQQNGEQQAGSFRSVRSDMTEAEMEEGLARQRSRRVLVYKPSCLLLAHHPSQPHPELPSVDC